MEKYYKLEGTKVVPVDSLLWAQWFETAHRVIGNDTIGDARVSTVFLGINHNWGDGPPLLFETMIFGGVHDGWQERCSTYEEALAMHAKAKKLLEGDEA